MYWDGPGCVCGSVWCMYVGEVMFVCLGGIEWVELEGGFFCVGVVVDWEFFVGILRPKFVGRSDGLWCLSASYQNVSWPCLLQDF